MTSPLWEHDTPVSEFGIVVPSWIESDITCADVAAIIQGGCASGAYMPAVTYRDAAETMGDHGDEVLQFLQDCLGELPNPADSESWSGMAVFYLSCAVETWAHGTEHELETAVEAANEGGDE